MGRSPPQRRMSFPEIGLAGSPGAKRRRAEVGFGDERVLKNTISGMEAAGNVSMNKLENLAMTMLQMKDDIAKDLATKESLLGTIENIIAEVLTLHADGSDHRVIRPLATSIGTQTMSPRETKIERDTQAILQEVSEGMDDALIKQIAGKWWPKAAFRCTKPSRQNIASSDDTRVMLIDPTEETCKGLIDSVLAQVPSMERIMSKKPAAGQIATAECCDTATLEGEDANVTTGIVRKTICGFISKDEDIDEQIIRTLRRIMIKLQGIENKKFTLSAGNLTDGSKLRKYAECLFVNKGYDISIFTPRKKGNYDKTKVHKPKTDTILIKSQPGESFADVVAKLKTEIKPEELGVTVRKLTKTPDGNVQMIVNEKKKGGRQMLMTELAKTRKDVKVRATEKSVIIHDLEESVTSEELQNTLANTLGETNVTAVTIRKGKSGLNMAIVRMPAKAAEKATKLATLKIGWTFAKIREMVVPEVCRSCQGFGHRTCQVKNPADLCRRCGERGHFAKGCEKEPHCYVCKCKGHRADSMACPEYRTAVRLVEKERRGATTKKKKEDGEVRSEEPPALEDTRDNE